MKQNKKKLYESIMTSVAKEVKKVLNEDTLYDNTKKYLSNENYVFYDDICRYLQFIFDNLQKLDGSYDAVLLKNVGITGTLPYTEDDINISFSTEHIMGLLVQEAIIECLTTYVNGFKGEQDDYAEIIDTIGRQGFDISEHIAIHVDKDNEPVSDFAIEYKGKMYKIQVKAVNKSHQKNPMNDAIRNGNDLGIVIVYVIDNDDVIIDQLQIYVPDAKGTFDYISSENLENLGKNRLSLDPSQSFLTIGARLLRGNAIR